MKVLDLGCSQAHVFEGWFASEEDLQSQLARGLLECPVCGDLHIQKRLSAPRLNLKAGHQPEPASTTTAPATGPLAAQAPALPPEAQAMLLQMVREVVSRTEDVGDSFAREARRMHYGEIEQRSIRGSATADDAMSLLDEGIDVLPLPDLDLFKQTLQ
ncbi:MAG TPA: DUF1178 family protein [Macromonas sp.]|nr:DUF1178 family protein [Macromonas sp.]